MPLETRTFSQFVDDMTAVVQGSAAKLLDVSTGSVLRAVLEAGASVALWLQWLISDVMNSSRAATASGGSLDSWMADFSFTRLPASHASGQVLFGRYNATREVTIPVGSTVRTPDGSIVVSVLVDRSHPCWVEAAAGYKLGAGQYSIELPVESSGSGAAMNIQAGTLTLLASALAGIDTVTNNAPLVGGIDAETDHDFRRRFLDYINSRSLATLGAVRDAIQGTRQGLNFIIDEGVNESGDSLAGHFVVTVDDGTGFPPSSLLQQLSDRIEDVRPIGTSFSVTCPDVILASVSVSLSIDGDTVSSSADLRLQVTNAIIAYIQKLSIGQELSVTRVAQVAYAQSQAVQNVRQITINGTSADLVPAHREVIKPGTVSVL